MKEKAKPKAHRTGGDRLFWRLLYLFSLLLALAVIPVGMLLFSLPLWAAAVFAAFPILICAVRAILGGSAAAFSLRMAGALLAAGTCLLGSFCNPYWGSYMMRGRPDSLPSNTVLTYAQAEEDLNELESVLRRVHPLFLDETPEVFEDALREARETLLLDSSITAGDLRRAVQTVVSVLQDAHTTVYAVYSDQHYRLDYAELALSGFRPVAVNGVSLEEFFRKNSRLFSYEAESWGMDQLENNLYSVEGLAYLGLSPDGYELTFSDGTQEIVRSYTGADFVPYDKYMEKNASYYADRDDSFVSYEIDEQASLALLTLDSCKWNEEYREALREMFTEVKARGIRNVAVDLRQNGGGNSLVVNEFLRYLDLDSYRELGMQWRLGPFLLDFPPFFTQNERIEELTFRGKVYLLSSSSTFSSAMMFTEYIKDNALGTIIGEAPGNAANSLGDITCFRLPQSGLMLQCSTKRFTRPSGGSERFVEPDIPCEAKDAEEVLRSVL